MSDDVQRLRHWQIKDFPEEKRRRVTQAAQLAGKTVADWLEPVIDAAIDGVNAPVNRVSGHSAADGVDDLCRLVNAACEFAQHREQMQRDLAAAVSRSLQGALSVKTGLPAEVNQADQAAPPQILRLRAER